MKPIARLSLEELAGLVCQSLADAGIRVTLTGGACVAIWSDGAYESADLDFIEHGFSSRRAIREVLGRLGFHEKHRYFAHPEMDFLIEFPAGPLAVGDAPVDEVAERSTETGVLRLLSPTDCVKDRLAAWFHWNDRQALDQAVLVARAQAIDMGDVRRWAKAEGAIRKLTPFLRAVELR